MKTVKVFIHKKFKDKDGNRYLTGDQDIPEDVAKSAAKLGWVGIYKVKKKKK